MSADPSERPTNVRWGVFSLAFATSALLYLHRYVFGLAKPMLPKEWGLTKTDLGRIDSAFATCYTLFQFPLAIVADFVGVHLVLSVLIAVWCGGLALMAWAPSAKVLWLGQVTLGTGQSAVYACLNRVSRNWFPLDVRTTLQGAVGIFAGRLGALSSGLVFAVLLVDSLKFDWRTAIWILVGVGAVHWVLFVTIFRNSPREHPQVNSAELRLIEGNDTATATERIGVTQMLRSLSPQSLLNLIWHSLQNFLSTFADNIYVSWIPLFLSDVHRLDFKRMGLYSALPLLGGALAGVIGGNKNDALIKKTVSRRWARAGVAMIGKGMAAVLMFSALLFYDRPYLFCSCLFFIKLFSDWSLSSSWGVVTDIGGRATASVFAFSNSIAGLAIITAPQVFGYIADHHGWRPVFVIVGTTYALSAASWLLVDSSRPLLKDVEGCPDGSN